MWEGKVWGIMWRGQGPFMAVVVPCSELEEVSVQPGCMKVGVRP